MPMRRAGLRAIAATAVWLACGGAAWAQVQALATVAQRPGGNPDKGRLIVQTRCVGCHALDDNRVGPALGSVFGRKAGTAPGYDYSQALQASGDVWTAERLLAWLANPEALIPGQAMGYRVDKPLDRQDVVAYLASLARPSATP